LYGKSDHILMHFKLIFHFNENTFVGGCFVMCESPKRLKWTVAYKLVNQFCMILKIGGI
jgi:hypothetical protein